MRPATLGGSSGCKTPQRTSSAPSNTCLNQHRRIRTAGHISLKSANIQTKLSTEADIIITTGITTIIIIGIITITIIIAIISSSTILLTRITIILIIHYAYLIGFNYSSNYIVLLYKTILCVTCITLK